MAVPSARTFEELKDAILRYNQLVDDTEADTIAGTAIRSALVKLAAYPLKSSLATSELTLTAGQNTVSIPSDFNVPFSLHLLDTSDKRDGRVAFLPAEQFDQLFELQEGEAGVPRWYTFRGSDTVLEMDHAPDSDEVTVHPKVRLRYFRRYDNLSTNTATFSVPPEFEEFIVWTGRRELTSIYDPKKFPLAQQEAARALLDLTRRDTIRDEMDWS